MLTKSGGLQACNLATQSAVFIEAHLHGNNPAGRPSVINPYQLDSDETQPKRVGNQSIANIANNKIHTLNRFPWYVCVYFTTFC